MGGLYLGREWVSAFWCLLGHRRPADVGLERRVELLQPPVVMTEPGSSLDGENSTVPGFYISEATRVGSRRTTQR